MGILKVYFSLCHIKEKKSSTDHYEKSPFFTCQVSFHSGLYALTMKFSKFVNGGNFLWKNVFFLYNGENDIHYFTKFDTWLFHTTNMESKDFMNIFVFSF